LLDGALAEAEGFTPLRRLLADAQCPIIVLARQSDPLACARALDLGASDWIARPFSAEELFARVRAALRAQRSAATTSVPAFTTGELSIDFAQRLVTVGGAAVALSKTEYKLLRTLAHHPGMVLAHDMLLERVWGPGYADAVDFVWVYIRRLRRKIEPDPARPRYILTVPGVGYQLARD
jgi:two-component system KDP operon response regulator KdpE